MSELTIPLEMKQLWSSRQTLLTLVLAFGSTCLGASWLESTDAVGAPDRSLSFVLGIVLPLTAFSFVRVAASGTNLRSFAQAAARHGASRRASLLRSLTVLCVSLIGLSALLTAVALVLSHGASDPRLVADGVASVPVASAAALAYVWCLSAGATFGARGAGSLAFLVSDAILGAFPYPAAWATPRGHVRHLLGLEGAASLPQWVSFPALLAFTLVGLAIVCARVPR